LSSGWRFPVESSNFEFLLEGVEHAGRANAAVLAEAEQLRSGNVVKS
jgi:hypothetical protein